MEALYRYQYNADNLSLKLRENELLLRILDHFDEASYQELLSHRKRRSERHPYEYAYESKVEEIEGTATYVEWMTLRQLDEQAAAAMTQRMRVAITKPERLFPIRISCYYSGALMVNALAASGAYSFNAAERPIACSMLKTVCPSDGDFPERESCCRKVSDAITSFEETSAHIIQSAIKKNKVVLNGPAELLCVNIYDARFYKGYMTSRFFLMYRDGSSEKMLPGNFVIEMADEKTISKVYEALTRFDKTSTVILLELQWTFLVFLIQRCVNQSTFTSVYSRLPKPSAAAASMVWTPFRLSTRSRKCALPGSSQPYTRSMHA